jgi:hypothetical protein
MAKYAVGYYDNMGTGLTIEIIEAENWKEALSKHSYFADSEYTPEENFGWFSDDIETAKKEGYNADFEFDVVLIN